MRHTPRLVLCLGLPGSASTWIFNVVRQMHGLPRRSILSGYLDRRYEEFLQAMLGVNPTLETIIIKSHRADTSLLRCVSERGAPCILSVRDPRDCVVSLMERFGFSFEHALTVVDKSCRAVLSLAAFDTVLLRYEDGFYRDGQTISDLYRYLQLAEAVDCDTLLSLNARPAVERFIATFDLLPQGRVVRHEHDEYDKVSHWHRRHFGDGAHGKWRTRLDAEQIATAQVRLAEAIGYFDYGVESLCVSRARC
jgi:hypothetical protein